MVILNWNRLFLKRNHPKIIFQMSFEVLYKFLLRVIHSLNLVQTILVISSLVTVLFQFFSLEKKRKKAIPTFLFYWDHARNSMRFRSPSSFDSSRLHLPSSYTGFREGMGLRGMHERDLQTFDSLDRRCISVILDRIFARVSVEM